MNLKKLFEKQRILDARIEKEHPLVKDEDRLGKKILALQVEFGELANELPEEFKFWSNKKNNYEKALKEYVDGLHFILSIGLEYKIDMKLIELQLQDFGKWDTTDKQFNYIFHLAGYLPYISSKTVIDKYYVSLFIEFVSLGKILGFTWEQIEQAYYDKNEINHSRQNSGY